MREPSKQPPAADRGLEIRDAVGLDVLRDLLSDMLDLIPTAAAIHGRDGECVLEMPVSGWCRLLHARQAAGCALCWTGPARQSVGAGKPAEGRCPGDLNIYAVPILVDGEIIGSVSFAHGEPPRDPRRIQEIAATFAVDAKELAAHVASHPSLSAATIDLTRRRVHLTARMIEIMVARWRAERALRESEERYALAVRAGKVGVWDYDVATKHLATFAMHELLGLDERDVPNHGPAWFEMVHPDDRDRVLKAVEDHIAGRTRRYHDEHRLVCPDGRVCWVLSSGSVLPDEAGRPTRMLGTSTDITERKRMEEEHARLEAQLRHAQKMEALGQLAGGVAHDFNNLLTAVLGHVELGLEDVKPGSSAAVSLEQIARAGQRAATLTRQLLAFSRRQALRPEILDPNRVLADMELMLRRLIGETIALKLRLSSSGYIRADAGHFEQVIMNLVVNARDAMPQGGRLTVETANQAVESAGPNPNDPPPGCYVVCAVRDTGCGMDAETVEHIFEPFFTTKPANRGTGLGLSTVYGIVKQARGYITVTSRPGEGATFRVFLPTVDLPLPQPPRPTPLATFPPADRTILVCEDEEPVRTLACEILRRGGYRVLAARSGAGAQQAAAAHSGPIHLLVSDMILPDGDGRRVAAALRTRYPDLRVLYISGYTADVIERHGELEADVEFLEKPFTPSQFLHRVRAVLEGSPAAR